MSFGYLLAQARKRGRDKEALDKDGRVAEKKVKKAAWSFYIQDRKEG